MRRVVPLLIVLCLGFAPAPVYREKRDTHTDLEKMQGSWQLVYTVKDGKRENATGKYFCTIVQTPLSTCASVPQKTMTIARAKSMTVKRRSAIHTNNW